MALDDSTIIGIISGIVTGAVTGVLGIYGVSKSTKATLEIANSNIEAQLDLQKNDYEKKEIAYIKEKLITIYENLLAIERSHDITSIYIGSAEDKDSNDKKYIKLIEKLDYPRALCDLYFPNELSNCFNEIQQDMAKYWKSLDDYFIGTDEQKSQFRDNAYNITNEIRAKIREAKGKIQEMISKYTEDRA